MKFSRCKHGFSLAQLPFIMIETAFCFVPRRSFVTSSSKFFESQVFSAPMVRAQVGPKRFLDSLRSSPDMRKILSFSFAALMVLAFCAFSAMAQSTTQGAITGTVKNPNNEVVAGATVSAKNNETNKEATDTSDNTGGFRIVNLDPGTYTVTVNASGFAAF